MPPLAVAVEGEAVAGPLVASASGEEAAAGGGATPAAADGSTLLLRPATEVARLASCMDRFCCSAVI